jgi:NAD+ diphosphatase
LDRDADSRTVPGLVEDAWSAETTRVVAIWRGEVLCHTDGRLAVSLLRPSDIPQWDRLLYLGKATDESGDDLPPGSVVVGAILTDEQARTLEPDVARWVSGRTSGHALDARDAGLLVEALALSNWHRSHRFSPETGNATRPSHGGWVLVDEITGQEIYPRTDAAIIVLVTDSSNRIVLGSNAMWEAQRYSLLAGFVEPGESLEAAVIREVFEESGLVVKNPTYWGSQPWPFPASLMVGFRAELDESASGRLRPDGTEIIDLRWFSREELESSLGDIVLPGPTSIARQMIDDWFGKPLVSPSWK